MKIEDHSSLPDPIQWLKREKQRVRSGALSQDKQLNELLATVVDQVTLYAENQISKIRRLTQIGLALTAEKNIDKLLEMIVDEARSLCRADAGTLYLLDREEQLLQFRIFQNDSLGIRIGGTSGDEIPFPSIAMVKDGAPNYFNVSSYAALSGKSVNIPDVYETEVFDFTGPKQHDAQTGYRSTSMLVIPMKNHENDVIGVMQLLNAQDPESGTVVPFSEEYVELIGALASQAAIALTNAHLIQELQSLFYSFIKSIATAIDQKSPYTGGHIKRVVKLTMMMMEQIHNADKGPLAEVRFSNDEFEELRLAAWMHDVGKIVTPEYMVNKRTKLETIFDRITLLETRFDLIAQILQNRFLEKKLALIQTQNPDCQGLQRLKDDLSRDLEVLEEERAFLVQCNCPDQIMSDEKIHKLQEVASKTYKLETMERPYLTADECYNLSVRGGSLTEKERRLIEQHSLMTLKILSELPFPRRIAQVPAYAAAHHEKINGSGYPFGLKGEQLPLQARIIAIADIFEALTAKDRPYRAPLKLSKALAILEKMRQDEHIDPDILDELIASGVFKDFAKEELDPTQIDVPD
ncbi:MAG: GAF domain-containing protein [Deltaproteobacteria bacterium]|nr:GAF domain-containing protein [Deltaproteobacteria bacterium]